ncbi:MAG TPA: ABC transporter substrate-binding protein [Limnochordia bacterium]|nr:ABC transporter substrate-binding protein [Limnochordia bacterium]HPP73318.1 ABC transporter substrate-binding protein [Limnochordia bacterium]
MKRIISLVLVTMLFSCLLPAAVAAQQSIDVYSIMPESFAIPFFEAFTAKTGIKINFVRHSAGEVLARLIAEKNNPRVAMVFGGPADTFAAAIAEDVLEPYIPQGVEAIPEAYRHPEGYFTGIALNPIVFLTNKSFLEENNMQPPKSWYDLLDPAYANGLQMADARTSGTGFNRIASIIFALGDEEEAFDYMAKLHENVQVYTKSGGGGTVPVATRQASSGVFFLVDSIETARRGYDVVISFPKEGSVVSVEAMALVKNGPNQELAKQFMDWLVTEEAQSLFAEHHIGFLPARPDVPVSDLIDLEGANFFELDLEWAAEHRQRVIERWVEEIVGF